MFVSICAVALCIETNYLLHLPLNKPGFYFFVFGGVLFQYNLHYFVKKTAHFNSSYLNWSQKNRGLHLILAGVGILFILTGVFDFKIYHFFILLILGLITLIYSLPLLPFTHKKRLKDFGILKITTLVLFWTLITVWLPATQVNYIPKSYLLVFISRFVFLFALCLVFDIRDTEIDKKENIRTIPLITGIKKSYLLIYSLLGLFIMLALIQYAKVNDTGRLNAMILSTAATFIMIIYTRKNKSEIAYLTCIDGMMLLQAFLVIIGSA